MEAIDVWYNSHGKPMSYKEFIELEVKERENYTNIDVDRWSKKYNLTDDTKCLWVCNNYKKFLNMYHEDSNGIFKYTNEDGFIIPESDDGDSGFLLILRAKKNLKYKIDIYTDGGYCIPKTKGAWAFVVLTDGTKTYEKAEAVVNSTNNIMEMTAAVEAMRYILENVDYTNANMVLHTDSQYVCKGLVYWVKGWKRKNWRTADGQEVKNKEIWIELSDTYDKINKDRNLYIKWVKGHNGNTYNEYADAMIKKLMND